MRAAPLAFPAGARPRVDLTHPACRGSGTIVRLSAIAMGGGFVDLTTGARGGVAGSPSFGRADSALGPYGLYSSSGDRHTFSGKNTAVDTSVTIAAIFRRITSGGSYSGIVGTSNSSNTGLGICVESNQLNIIAPGQGTRAYANLENISAGGDPYFAAASFAQSPDLSYAVLVNLRTGQTFLDSGLGLPPLGPTDGTYTVGTATSSNTGFGNIAAACVTNKLTHLRDLQRWAERPWSFWYDEDAL